MTTEDVFNLARLQHASAGTPGVGVGAVPIFEGPEFKIK
jgi:hypothetical protein